MKTATVTTRNHGKLLIWDLPTRIFHWLFATCVVGAIATVKLGEGMWMEWHIRFGILTLALLVFRIVWGFTGTYYVRFADFIRGPRAIIAYIRGQTPPVPGHSPLGALSVLAMLTIIGIQAVSGLFVSDDILYDGPFHADVSSATAAFMRDVHINNAYLVMALIALHVLAILYYTVIGKGIAAAMVTGNLPAERFPTDSRAANPTPLLRIWALVLALCCGAGAWWLIDLAESAGGMYF